MIRRNARRAAVAAKHALPAPDDLDDWTCHVCGRHLDEMCEACDDEVEEMLDGIEDGWAHERRTQ